jgi:arsenate reductase (thioredoxin)
VRPLPEGFVKPTILFVCVHNAGRSQMAAAYARLLSEDRVDVLSAGSEPVDDVHPAVIDVMREDGIDLARITPRLLSADDVRAADAVITMGCGDACPIFPGKRYEDWELADPAGRPREEVRAIRDEIKGRVRDLLDSIDPAIRRG